MQRLSKTYGVGEDSPIKDVPFAVIKHAHAAALISSGLYLDVNRDSISARGQYERSMEVQIAEYLSGDARVAKKQSFALVDDLCRRQAWRQCSWLMEKLILAGRMVTMVKVAVLALVLALVLATWVLVLAVVQGGGGGAGVGWRCWR
jgi:hypothetical protein